ncbi:MAG: hypothetical protein EHM53_03230 [Methanoregulaceae archaeon]|nr:MAG: hypothetical protein EHM53_03230 [Methanoregulaceae archaeon]
MKDTKESVFSGSLNKQHGTDGADDHDQRYDQGGKFGCGACETFNTTNNFSSRIIIGCRKNHYGYKKNHQYQNQSVDNRSFYSHKVHPKIIDNVRIMYSLIKAGKAPVQGTGFTRLRRLIPDRENFSPVHQEGTITPTHTVLPEKIRL